MEEDKGILARSVSADKLPLLKYAKVYPLNSLPHN